MSSRTLQDAIDSVRHDDQDKWDLAIPFGQLTMEDGRVVLGDGAPRSKPGQLEPNDWAANQLCSQLGMPAGYFKRCPAHLQDEQFNYWLKQATANRDNDAGGKDMWLLRSKGSTLRAVLSPRYSRLDNSVLIDCLERQLDPSLVVQFVSITDISFHLRLLKPMTKHLVRVGDQICAGIHIANSEVGMRAVTVDALVYRLVCTNGMIRTFKGESLYRRRHVGITQEDMAGALPEAIGRSLVEAEDGLVRFAATIDQPVADPIASIKDLARQHQLSDGFAERMRRLLEGELSSVQETRYGLINALTGAARSETPDERYRIESIAGTLIEV